MEARKAGENSQANNAAGWATELCSLREPGVFWSSVCQEIRPERETKEIHRDIHEYAQTLGRWEVTLLHFLFENPVCISKGVRALSLSFLPAEHPHSVFTITSSTSPNSQAEFQCQIVPISNALQVCETELGAHHACLALSFHSALSLCVSGLFIPSHDLMFQLQSSWKAVTSKPVPPSRVGCTLGWPGFRTDTQGKMT